MAAIKQSGRRVLGRHMGTFCNRIRRFARLGAATAAFKIVNSSYPQLLVCPGESVTAVVVSMNILYT